jgi:hypothetical protein
MKIIGVNRGTYNPKWLEDAVASTGETTSRIELLAVDEDYYKTCTIEYRGGALFPHLVRDESKPNELSELMRAAAGEAT